MKNLTLKAMPLVTCLMMSPATLAGLQEGIDLANRGEFALAIAGWTPLVEEGYAPAIYQMGSAFENGFGVERDYLKARELYLEAARQGNADAEFALSVLYAEGLGVVQDYQQAYEWLQRAARQGQDRAEFNLGVMYANGQGVEKDLREAMKWYQKAAEKNYALAQFNLAIMYYEGQGVVKDGVKSYIYNSLAARNGYYPARKSRDLDARELKSAQKRRADEEVDKLYKRYEVNRR